MLGVTADEDLLRQIAIYSNGDARTAYNILELAAAAAQNGTITAQAIEDPCNGKYCCTTNPAKSIST